MSQIEERLRQELHDMAQQIAPAGLRPLRAPSGRGWSRRGRWLAPVGAMVGVMAVIIGLLLAGNLSVPASSGPSSREVRVTDPAAFAATMRASTSLRSGIQVRIVLLSPVTGRIVRSVTTTAMAAGIGNRFAYAPDGRSVYVQKPHADHRFALEQISIASDASRVVGYGIDPAVSPDSQQVAYVTGSGGKVAIRDLRTGLLRRIRIARLVGQGATMFNGGRMAWLSDGTQLVVLPQLIPLNGPVGSKPATGCVPANDKLCLIVIDASGPRLIARRIFVPTPGSAAWGDAGLMVIGGAADRHRLLLAASGVPGANNGVEAVEFSPRGAVVRTWRVRSLPSGAVPVAIAPRGDRLIIQSPLPGSHMWLVRLSGGPAGLLPVSGASRIVQVGW